MCIKPLVLDSIGEVEEGGGGERGSWNEVGREREYIANGISFWLTINHDNY